MTPEEIAAAKAAEEAAKGATPPEGQTDPAKKESITLTQKELDEKIASEADRRVTEAIKTRAENLRKEAEEKVRKEYELKAEDEKRKAKMTADERAAAERKEIEDELAKVKADKEALELSYKRKELVVSTITEKKLDPRLSDFLTGETKEALDKQADTLNAVVADEIKKVYGQGAQARTPGATDKLQTQQRIDTTGMSVKEALRACPVLE